MLSPEEIKSREFLVSLRGYDRDEVHAFLGTVADQLAEAKTRAEQLERDLEQARSASPAPAAAAPAAAPSADASAMFAEIGKETQRILEAAQEAGSQIQRRARQDADRELQNARSQSAKVIAEGERRRDSIERTVNELEAARATLSRDLRTVMTTMEQTLRGLESRETPSTSVREALSDDLRRGGEGAASGGGDIDAPLGAVTEPSADDSETPESPESPAPSAEDSTAEAAPDPTAGEQSDRADQGEQPAAPAPEAEAPTAPTLEPDAGTDSPDSSDVAAELEALSAPSQGSQASAPSAAPSPAAEERPRREQDPQALRASALSPLHPKFVRSVKRELQEVQNIAMDRVRRARGQGAAQDFLPDDDEITTLGQSAGDFLQQAYTAGSQSAGTLAGRDLAAPDAPDDLSDVFSRDAGERVRSGLTSTLEMGLSSSESAPALSDRIGAVFGELKGTQAEELAATHLIRAYELGMLDAWRKGGIGSRQWVMGREPRCPEARCRQNDQGGALGLGQAFPSGHDVPPVHVGCTCTTIPVLENSE